MDPRELVEITFRLPLEALGRLAPLLDTAGRGTVQERTEGGEGASFDMERFETVRAGEPELPEDRRTDPGEPEVMGRRMETAEPVLPEETAREVRDVALGESVRQEWEVSLKRLAQGTVETWKAAETAEGEAAADPRALSALWERDARRYDGAFPLL